MSSGSTAQPCLEHAPCGTRFPRRGSSELLRLLNRYEQAGIKVGRSRVYNNWGGYISQADVQGLDIDITGGDTV